MDLVSTPSSSLGVPSSCTIFTNPSEWVTLAGSCALTRFAYLNGVLGR
jgi:hypothetical protein